MSWTRPSENDWHYPLVMSLDSPEDGPFSNRWSLESELLSPWKDYSTFRHYTAAFRYPDFTIKFWYNEDRGIELPKNENDFSLYTYSVLTGLPDFDANGFLDTSKYFKGVKVGALYKNNNEGTTTDDIKINTWINRSHGRWDNFYSYWLDTMYTEPYTCIYAQTTSAAAAQNGSNRAATGGEITEVLRNKVLHVVAPESSANYHIINPDSSMLSDPGRFADISDQYKYSPFWPWLFLNNDDGHSTSEVAGDRDYRNGHLKINSAFSTYTGVLVDWTENRYPTAEKVALKSEEYINQRLEHFNILLESTIEVPKEFRVRTQNAPRLQISKISSMAMPSTPSQASEATTSTSSDTMGGSTY